MRVRNEHWEVLLSCCEENPQLVTNRFSGFEGRAKGNALWQNITTKLNSMGYGEKSVDGWRKTLTDWKSKTKNNAAALKREQRQTGGGPPQLPPLSSLEERLLLIMGTKALEGDTAVPELGFGGLSLGLQKENKIPENMPNRTEVIPPIMEVPYIAELNDHEYMKMVDIPSTSHDSFAKEVSPGISRGLKRKMEQQGSMKSRPFRHRKNATVVISNELINLNQQSVEILKDTNENVKSLSVSVEKISSNVESIANSLREIVDIVRNYFSHKEL